VVICPPTVSAVGEEVQVEDGEQSNGVRRLRADARRNREQLLAAARDVFVEEGADAALDEIARRAGVGIATLYRRFPDRQSLMRAVVLDVLGRTAYETRLALAEEPDAFAALVRYMHRAVDLRIAAVIPALMGQVSLEDEEMLRARDDASRPLQAIVDAAHSAGRLRPEVTFGDIGVLVIRFSRPLPGGFPRELNDQLAHRHLELLVTGLQGRDEGATETLGGPAMTLDDLRAVSPDPGAEPPFDANARLHSHAQRT
jgi:AcrR family transcriptional regulator